MKIKAKHNQENFTLSLPEYEEILDALVGSHYSTVPDHLSHENHHELGALLMQVRAKIMGLACCPLKALAKRRALHQSFTVAEAQVTSPS